MWFSPDSIAYNYTNQYLRNRHDLRNAVMSYRCTAICLLSFVVAAPSSADSILEFQSTEFDQGQPIVGTVEISTSGKDTRLEIISVSSAEAGGMIFHGERDEMIILDHAQGNYMIIDQARMNAMASQVSQAMSQMQEALAAMPPEQRALAEQMMQQRFPTEAPQQSPNTINDLGSHGEVAGIPCRNFEVIRDGRKVRELCMSEWDDIEGGQETAAALKDVAEFFESMRQAFSGAGAMEVFDRQQELFGHMDELDGYPVLYRDFDASGALKRQVILTSARADDVSPASFQPPSGYEFQELPMGTN
jgi:hypothetical protein